MSDESSRARLGRALCAKQVVASGVRLQDNGEALGGSMHCKRTNVVTRRGSAEGGRIGPYRVWAVSCKARLYTRAL